MISPTSEDDLFRAALRQKNASSLRLGSLLAMGLLPVFWILDWYILNDYVKLTAVLRGGLVIFGFVIVLGYHLRRDGVAKYVDWLAPLFEILIATSIAFMCWLDTGYASGYYAGLNLTIITAGFLFTWNLRQSLVSHGLVYAIYIAPLPQGLVPMGAMDVFLNNQFFLIGTIVIMVASQEYRFRLEARQFEDERDLRRAKATIEAALDKLKELDRMKVAFFNNVTHELRTPLTMILAPLEGLLEENVGALSSEQKDFLRPIWRNALKLLKLINDLLDLAKLDEKHLRLSITRTSMVELLEEVVEYSRPLAWRKKIEVELKIHESVDDLYLDLDKIERSVINLVSNALKFTENGGRLEISYESSETEVQVEFKDTGIGIPEDELEQIFERFSQVDNTSTRRFGGTGIGLALAREMVELHGGRISVSSFEGEGTSFYIHLTRGDEHLDEKVLDRRAAREPSLEQRRSEDQGPHDWTRALLERKDFKYLDIEAVTERRVASRGSGSPKSTKVLVVEDNLDILRFISQQLRGTYDVFHATNGAEGLKIALNSRPDVVVMDIQMPVMDGLALLQALRADETTKEVPIIMLTAKKRFENQLDARVAGADVYLTKPFSPKVLRAAVRRLLDRRSAQTEVVKSEQVKSLEHISRGLAHEMRNPLSFVQNALVLIGEQFRKISQILADSDLSPNEQRERVEKCQSRIERMLETGRRGTGRLEELVEVVRRYAREG